MAVLAGPALARRALLVRPRVAEVGCASAPVGVGSPAPAPGCLGLLENKVAQLIAMGAKGADILVDLRTYVPARTRCISCKTWYSISQTVSDLGNVHDRSIRAFAFKPRAFGAPLSGFGA